MVSFFGLKFGADKRKKRAEPTPLQLPHAWTEAEEYMGRRESHFPLKADANRPRTSQGLLRGSKGSCPGEPPGQPDSDFQGVRAVLLGTTAACPAGTGPVLNPTLKTFSSDSNLGVSLTTRNFSSISLGMPPTRRGDADSELGPRPETAHSMCGFTERKATLHTNHTKMSTSALGAPVKTTPAQDVCSPVKSDDESLLDGARASGPPPLHTNLPNASTATLAGSSRSPQSLLTLASPLKSDTGSLLGDDPYKIADEIVARIRQEDDQNRPLTSDERRRMEAELEVQKKNLEVAKRNLEVARLTLAFPSPPSSIRSEPDTPSVTKTRSTPSHNYQSAAGQNGQLTSKGHETNPTPSTPESGTGQGTTRADVNTPTSSRQGSIPTIEAPLSPAKAISSATPAPASSEMGSMEPSITDGSLSSTSRMLRPSAPRELQRPAAAPVSNPLRSPLFQQMSPFDIHTDDEDEDEHEYKDEHERITNVAKRAPYGLPSPPLSHRQRLSKEEGQDEGLPVLRNVEAKRNTALVGTRGRTSLALQIEEFEKSLQQAQAMSAMEKGSESAIHPLTSPRSRGNSNASSNYSDMCESPGDLEPPLVSPKPFPLSPRPMGRRATPTDAASSGRSTSVVGTGTESSFEEYFGPLWKQTGDSLSPRVPLADNSAISPAEPPRPRLGAVKSARPPLGEYGNVKVNKVAAVASRVHRPSPAEYGIPLQRTASPFQMDSPIPNDTIAHHTTASPCFLEDMTTSDDNNDSSPSSTCTSRISSPTAVASHSVFSPPTAALQPRSPLPPPSRSARPGWFSRAPTAPPSSPLPMPENSAGRHRARKDTFDIAGRAPSLPITPSTGEVPPSPRSPATLQTSPSIVPHKPNWPLLGTSSATLANTPSPGEGGFSARRTVHCEGSRAKVPAPINVMAAKYADEIVSGAGLWSPDMACFGTLAARRKVAGDDGRPPTAENARGRGEEQSAIQSDLNGWKEERAPYHGEDKSGVIGMARGSSVKHDETRERDRDRRARGQERSKRLATAKMDEEEREMGSRGPTSSPEDVKEVQLLMERRPNHGLKSPMGFADEQGVRFI